MIGWAIIGLGGMGTCHVERFVSKLPDLIKICGEYDIDPETRKTADRLGIRAYDSLEELLSDEEVSLVTLAVPNDLHRDLAIQCMKRGKHVISEKPVTLSLDDLYQMINASRETGKIFTVHQNRRWDEDYQTVKRIYDENMLGKVFNIESRVHGSRGIPGDWRNQYVKGGGMILDWGIHLLDQILMLVDEDIVSSYCKISTVTNEEVDDGFTAMLTFGSGLRALVEVGTSNFINLPRWYVQGQNGTAVVNDFSVSGEIVKVSDWEKRDAVPVVTAAGLTKTMAPRTEDTIRRYPLPEVKPDILDFYRNVVAAIEGRETQLITHKQQIRLMKLVEALFRSAKDDVVIHERI